MEGTLAPRTANPAATSGFQENPGGGTLVLGRPRYVKRVAALGATFVALGAFTVYLAVAYGSAMRPGGDLGILLSGLLFFGFAGVLLVSGFVSWGVWVLGADDQGIRLVRPHRRPKVISWAAVKRIQVGPTAISMGRYGARLGDALRIDARHAGGPVILDTVRLTVLAEDLDRMATVLKDLGGRHGVPVEAFPMAGRTLR